MKIGFIGTGVMGTSMIKHLLEAGYSVHVFNRTQSHANEVIEAGAKWTESPAALTTISDVLFTMVGFPTDVEEIYFGEKGIFSVDVTGKILVDLTTSSPTLAEKIFLTAQEKGAEALDAPVSGGDLGAQNATLTIMVGGMASTFEKVRPLFEVVGQTLTLHGEAGKGQHTKMANQIMIAGTMTGLSECLVYADQAGLDLEKVLATLAGGSAANWSLANYGPRILREDYTPGFFVKHFVKDLRIALEESAKAGLDLPATKLAKELYETLSNQGFENDGTQALIKLWWENGSQPKKIIK